MAATVSITPHQVDQTAGLLEFDQLILQALENPRDRQLLLRADTLIAGFVEDVSTLRIRLEPPLFPNLNSFQRLLVHKLADTYGISRTIEQPSGSALVLLSPTENGSTANPAIMTLIKTPQTPKLRLEMVANSVAQGKTQTLSTDPVSQTPADIKEASEAIRQQENGSNSDKLKETPEKSENSPTIQVPTLASTTIRIMARAGQNGSRVSPSGSGQTSPNGTGRKVLSLQEREAAYAVARERIFKEDIKAVVAQASGLSLKQATEQQSRERERLDSPESSRPSSPASKQKSGKGKQARARVSPMNPSTDFRPATPLSASTSLRPSAPAFDPSNVRGESPHFQVPANYPPYAEDQQNGNYAEDYPLPPGYYYPEQSTSASYAEIGQHRPDLAAAQMPTGPVEYGYSQFPPYPYPPTPVYVNMPPPGWPYPQYYLPVPVRSPTGEAVYQYLQRPPEPVPVTPHAFAYPLHAGPNGHPQMLLRPDADRLEGSSSASTCSSRTAASSFSHSLTRLETASASSASSLQRSPIKEQPKVTLGKGLPDLTRMRDTHNSKLKAKRRLASSRASSVSSRNDADSVADVEEPRELHPLPARPEWVNRSKSSSSNSLRSASTASNSSHRATSTSSQPLDSHDEESAHISISSPLQVRW